MTAPCMVFHMHTRAMCLEWVGYLLAASAALIPLMRLQEFAKRAYTLELRVAELERALHEAQVGN